MDGADDHREDHHREGYHREGQGGTGDNPGGGHGRVKTVCP